MLTDQRWDVERARKESLFPDVGGTTSFAQDFGAVIEDRGYRRVALDNWFVFPAHEYVALRKRCPDVEFIGTYFLSELRRIKSPAEIELLRRAEEIADAAV